MPCDCIDWGYSPDQGPRRHGHHPTCEKGLAMSAAATLAETVRKLTAPDITELTKLARSKGKMGVAVIEQTRACGTAMSTSCG